MEPVNILDARNNLSRLIAQAIDGEDVVISNRGKPVVRLVPVAEPAPSSTGAALAKWFEQNPPTGLSLDALNERIRETREGWE